MAFVRHLSNHFLKSGTFSGPVAGGGGGSFGSPDPGPLMLLSMSFSGVFFLLVSDVMVSPLSRGAVAPGSTVTTPNTASMGWDRWSFLQVQDFCESRFVHVVQPRICNESLPIRVLEHVAESADDARFREEFVADVAGAP